MATNPKFASIVGTAFPEYIQEQLTLRSQTGNKKKRDNKALQYLTNKNGWFRLSSAAIINNEAPPTKGGREAKVRYQNNFSQELAQDFVLQGGSIVINGPNNNETTLRKGFAGTYQEGDTDNLGLQPMPGITGITIGTGGQWQTFQEAEIDIIVYNLDQLDIIQKLYMSLGVHVLLEWGHSPYLNNNNVLFNNFETIDFFNTTDRDFITQEITRKRRDTCGNYDGVLGVVNNFNIQGDKDGAYLCKVNILGPGSAIESIKVPSSSGNDYSNPKEESDTSTKYSSTLDNALYAMDELLKTSKLYKTQKDQSGDVNTNFAKITADNWFKNWREPTQTTSAGTGAPGYVNPGKNKGSWGRLLNEIYSSATYTPFQFTDSKNIVEYSNEFAEFGNAAQIITGRHLDKLNPNSKDNLKTIPFDFYTGYIGSFKNDKKWFWQNKDEEISYITFGHLMALINSLGVFTYTDESKTSPIFYIDYHPDNTIVNKGPLTATINPFKAMVPFISNQPYQEIFAPLDITDGTLYNWQSDKRESFTSINLSNGNAVNRINEVYDPGLFAVDGKANSGGRLMNILVSIDFARQCIRNTNPNNKTSVIDYITRILDGINQSLGLVNSFRPYVDDCGYILRIVEEKLLNPEKFQTGTKQSILELQTFGFDSIVYNSSLTTAIGPDVQSQVIIATQALSQTAVEDFPDDLLNFENLNLGVIDRLMKKKEPGNKPPDNSTPDNKTDNPEILKSNAFLYKHIYNIYTAKVSDVVLLNQTCIDMEIPFSDLLGRKSKVIPSTSPKNFNNAATLLPYEYQITLDGISGIQPYSVFRIPNDRLPKAYRDRVVFSVFSINHDFENNSWRTTLRGQMVFTDDLQPFSTSTTISGTATAPDNTSQNPNYNTNYPKVTTSTTVTSDSNTPGLDESPTGGNVTDTTENTETETIINVTTGPDGQQSATFNTVPISSNQDINAAFTFIANNETNGTPELKAYEDKDYTVSAGFTYRIGYGSDTITSTDGTVTSVTRSSRITAEQATLDLKRRIRDEFKPKVINRLSSRGVNYNSLPLDVKVVFLDLAYNYGTLFYDFVNAWKNGGKQGVITELRRRAALGPGQVPSRREKEINYLNG